MADPSQTSPTFRDATLRDADFTNATIRGGQFRGLRVTDAWLVDVDLSGMVRNLTVNGVDVTAFVQAEMDRSLPERALIRSMSTADSCRAGWEAVERVWGDTIARARLLGAGVEHEHVRDEWSLIETIRHLVFVVDAWAQRTILGLQWPFHALGWPHTPYPREQARAIGLDLTRNPTLDEVVEAWSDRCEVMRRIVADLRDQDLQRICTLTPAPGYPEDEERTVGLCLRVGMDELLEHSAYANRDLDALATG